MCMYTSHIYIYIYIYVYTRVYVRIYISTYWVSWLVGSYDHAPVAASDQVAQYTWAGQPLQTRRRPPLVSNAPKGNGIGATGS